METNWNILTYNKKARKGNKVGDYKVKWMFTTKGNKTTQKYNADDGYKATKSKNND